VSWDDKAIPLKNADVVRKLREGDPPIEVRSSEPDKPVIEMAVWMLRPGEERVVGKRVRRILEGGA
jgi:hypothetical protein